MDLARVRDEVRAAREGGRIKPGEAVAVVLAPGEYPVTRTLDLGEQDGGTETAPVVLVDGRPNLPHSNPVVGNVFVNCKEPYSIDRLVKPLLDEMPVKGNSVLTVADGSTLTKPPQPITFAEAERTVVKSPDGRVAGTWSATCRRPGA